MGVSGCLWSSAIRAVCMPISVFLLLKVSHVSASSAEDTILWIVLHYVCIGLFLLGVVFNGRGEGQWLR